MTQAPSTTVGSTPSRGVADGPPMIAALTGIRGFAALAPVLYHFRDVLYALLPSTFVLYATYRYGWDTKMVGLTLALVGVSAMVVQGAGVGPIVKRLGERRALLLGLACGGIGFFIYGAAPTGPPSPNRPPPWLARAAPESGSGCRQSARVPRYPRGCPSAG